MGKNFLLCPSGICQDGALLIGIVGNDGKVSFIPQRMKVDHDFVEIAKRGRAPEKRFRFGNTCAESSCEQWTGKRCGVIDKIIDQTGQKEKIENLPSCSIQNECRWYDQCGKLACLACPEVITNSLQEK